MWVNRVWDLRKSWQISSKHIKNEKNILQRFILISKFARELSDTLYGIYYYSVSSNSEWYFFHV